MEEPPSKQAHTMDVQSPPRIDTEKDSEEPPSKRARTIDITSPPKNDEGFHLEDLKLPSKQWAVVHPDTSSCIVKINEKMQVACGLKINEDKITAEILGQTVRGVNLAAKNNKELESLIILIDSLRPCEGTNFGNHHKNCRGWISHRKNAVRCIHCNNLNGWARRQERRLQKKRLRTMRKHQNKVQILQRSNARKVAKASFFLMTELGCCSLYSYQL